MIQSRNEVMASIISILCFVGAWRLAGAIHRVFPGSLSCLPPTIRTACALCVWRSGGASAADIADLPSIREALREYHVALLFGKDLHQGGVSLRPVEDWAVRTCASLAFEFPPYIEWRIAVSVHEE